MKKLTLWAAVALLCLHAGCACSSEEAVAAPTPEGAKAGSPAPDPAPAVAAYRAAMAAFTRGDADAYFSAFTDPLVCFHGKRGHALASLKSKRKVDGEAQVYVKEALVVSATRDEVRLVDRGMWLMDEMSSGVHEKAILMRRVDGKWKIAGETSAKKSACLGDFSAAKKSPSFEKCRAASMKCDRSCNAPCKHISNGCVVCLEGCVNTVAKCMGVDRPSPYE